MNDTSLCGIYYIKNLVNNKYYVGQSINIERRWKDEKKRLSSDKKAWNTHLQNAWKMYGEDNFEFDIIEECLPAQLDDREVYWISFYDSFNSGYNQSAGGGGCRGVKFTEEHRKKISQSIKNTMNVERLREQREQYWSIPEKHQECSRRMIEWWNDPANKELMSGCNNKNYGQKRDWWAEKYSGINSSNHKCCIQIETGMFYCTITDASNEVGVSPGKISRVCSGKQKTAGGYHWRYATDEEVEYYLFKLGVVV